MTKHCQFFFAGVGADGGGSFSLQAGATPSRGSLRFPAGYLNSIPDFGDLVLTDAESVAIRFSNCMVTRRVVASSNSGRWLEVTLADRRWIWQGNSFAVYGHYNRAGAPYKQYNTKTAKQMAALLCDALGESGYDVSALPDVQGPSVEWDGHNPATELEALCEAYGCLVSLSTDDRIIIRRDGVGVFPNPSDSRAMDFTAAGETVATPKALVCEGGRSLIQHDLPIVPVGLEISGANAGQFVGIDSLTYKPDGGWAACNPGTNEGNAFLDLQGNPLARAMAIKYIWKRYAISGKFTLPLPPPQARYGSSSTHATATQNAIASEYFTIDRGKEWRLLPLMPRQLQEAGGTEAQILGWCYLHGANQKNTDGVATLADLRSSTDAFNYDKNIEKIPTPNNSKLLSKEAFTLDVENGFVDFARQTYFREAGLVYPAPLRLRTSFPIRDNTTHAFLCQQYWQFPGSPQADNLVKLVKRSDIWFEWFQGASGIQSNANSFSAQAVAALSGELNKYTQQSGASIPYKGFVVDMPPDGIVRTVTWDVAESGQGTTHIDFNMERPEAYFTLQEARNKRYVTQALWQEQQIRFLRARGILK